MDGDDVVYEMEHEPQFWAELDEILTSPCRTHESIDNALRSFLSLTVAFKGPYLQSEFDLAKSCRSLLESNLFKRNPDYVRRQILYCLLQEDDVDTLHLTAAVLLFDGRANESAFELMQTEGAFPRLVELIRNTEDKDAGLHRLLLELLFEMSRIQKLSRDDLLTVDDPFVRHLFQLIEELSGDADDPYHYPVIRVLLALNEQYMCLANAPSSPSEGVVAVTNRVLKLLSMHGPSYRTFGENLILLLNRESHLGPQLLILKLLYLLFTTPSTYEYFYTNDLHVLVDVIIRNLLDLDPGNDELDSTPDGSERDGQRVLRHTYLRVLCPLLKNTQLAREGNNYKREEVRKLLYLLVNRTSAHFAPVDETVVRLVIRCRQVEWLRDEGDGEAEAMSQPAAETGTGNSVAAKTLLGMSIGEAAESSLCVVDMSAKVTKEKPSVPAPRRMRKSSKTPANQKFTHGNRTATDHTLSSCPTIKLIPAEHIPRQYTRSPFADENAAA